MRRRSFGLSQESGNGYVRRRSDRDYQSGIPLQYNRSSSRPQSQPRPRPHTTAKRREPRETTSGTHQTPRRTVQITVLFRLSSCCRCRCRCRNNAALCSFLSHRTVLVGQQQAASLVPPPAVVRTTTTTTTRPKKHTLCVEFASFLLLWTRLDSSFLT